MDQIEISVITKIVFDNESDFKKYIESDYQAQITGFAKEVQISWKTQKPYIIETPRPQVGAVTTSEIITRRI